jgi:two-component system, response regulator PdtaR
MAQSAAQRPVVLIVEDEFLIRMRAAVVIEEAGFEVVEAADADEAIVILESRRDIRVVFTDIHMPGSMDGVKLAHAVKDRWPPVHIIATSAYYAALKAELPAGTVFLPKPYTEHNVVVTLHALTTSHRY